MRPPLPPAEAAAAIGCGRRHTENLIRAGTLLARKIGTGKLAHWRVVRTRSDLDPPRSGDHFLTLEEYFQTYATKTNEHKKQNTPAQAETPETAAAATLETPAAFEPIEAATPAKRAPKAIAKPMPAATLAVDIPQDSSLDAVAASVRSAASTFVKLGDAQAFVSICIGIALNNAKKMLRHGEFGNWCDAEFSGVLSGRQRQYHMRLAEIFLDERNTLALPAPAEIGGWLMNQRQDGELGAEIRKFRQGLDYSELLATKGVKVKIKTEKPDTYNPPALLVAGYRKVRPELAGVDPKNWGEEARAGFSEWAERNADKGSPMFRAMAAEGWWKKIRELLVDHYATRAAWRWTAA